MFGADTTQDTPVYTCECHRLVGGTNRGRICPDCGTEVRSIEADLRIRGHIDIAPYHILTYHGYVAFSKYFGSKVLHDYLTSVKRIDRKGKITDDGKPTIMDLYNDYDQYESELGIPRKIAFMSKIPVFTSRLRPLMKTAATVTILDVNKAYLSITSLANILKPTPLFSGMRKDVEIQRTLNQIQEEFMKVCDHINEQINEKSGDFRRSLAAGRLDNSARLVITLGVDLMAHEVDVPYQMMMVMYEEEIANFYSKLEGVSIAKAISEVELYQVHPNPKFIKIIKRFLNKKHGVWTIINREPTISESSYLYSRIRKIHVDTEDYTLRLPQDILGLLNADFDGDQCTQVAVKNPKYHEHFMNLCPTYAFIDRADGRFNRAMGFKKDYAALISAGYDIDSAIDSYLNNPDENSDENLKAYGLDRSDNETREKRNEIIKTFLEAGSTTLTDRFIDPIYSQD